MKKKFVGIFVLMLLIATAVLPVAGTVNIEHTRGKSSSNGTDWWPMFHHDKENSGYSTSTAPVTNNVNWSYTINGAWYSSPAIYDNKLYTGSYGPDGKAYCFNSINGDLIWTSNIGDYGTTSSPAVDAGKVYFGSNNNGLYCLDTSTGDELWKFEPDSGVDSSPVITEGKVYFGTNNGKIFCLNAESGDEIWRFETGWYIHSSPAIANGRIYIGIWTADPDYYGKLICLNAETGDLIWEYEALKSIVCSSPAIVDNKVYFGSQDGSVYCIDSITGDELWIFKTGSTVDSAPSINNGKIYIGSLDGYFYCFDYLSGDLIWKTGIGSIWRSSSVIADGKVFVGSTSSNFICLNAENGDIVWSYNTGGEIESSPSITDGRVYIGSHGKTLYCFKDEEVNHPPDKPTFSGPNQGKKGVSYTYSATTSDTEGDQLYYWFDWGDTTNSGWVGPYPSGDTANESHIWNSKGTFHIKVKAKDDPHGEESPWETLDVTITPRTKTSNYNFNLLNWLFERFPKAFPILRNLLEL